MYQILRYVQEKSLSCDIIQYEKAHAYFYQFFNVERMVYRIYKKIGFEYKIAIVYLILGLLWILFSDSIASSIIRDHDYLTTISIYKGILYVLITSILLYGLVKRHFRKLADANKIIQERTQMLEKQNKEFLKANLRLEKSEEKIRKAFDTSPDSISINRISDGMYLYANQGFEQIFGFDRTEVIGKFSSDLDIWVSTEARDFYLQSLHELGFVQNYETEFRSKNGNIINCIVSSSKVEIDGEEQSINIVKDISDRKKMENELLAAKEKAEESDMLKSSFLQNMSHEVRTPLNAIVGFSRLLTKSTDEPDKMELFTNLIALSSEKLIDIITDVVEISRFHTNQTFVELEDIELHTFIHAIVEKFRPRFAERNLIFQFHCNVQNKKLKLKADKEKLHRIFVHLLDNALKFTSKGTVKLNVSASKGFVHFSIEDTGIGIEESMLETIFHPFRQVETGLCRNYGGNGLGLTLSKKYIELMHGEIRVQSELGKGSTFSLDLPISDSDTAEGIKNTKAEPISVKNILIVEDEYTNYVYLDILLRNRNLNVLYAQNGLEALNICKTAQLVELIFMDIKMPIMDGTMAAQEIRKLRPDIHIIAQTGYALEFENMGFREYFDDYIVKPINEQVLNQKLEKYILG